MPARYDIGHFSWAIEEEMMQSRDCSFCVPKARIFYFKKEKKQ
jgi:hypothetical protein